MNPHLMFLWEEGISFNHRIKQKKDALLLLLLGYYGLKDEFVSTKPLCTYPFQSYKNQNLCLSSCIIGIIFLPLLFLAMLCQLLFHGTQGKTIKPMNLSPKIAQWLVLSEDEILIATLVVFLFFVAFFPYMAWIDELGY